MVSYTDRHVPVLVQLSNLYLCVSLMQLVVYCVILPFVSSAYT